ncbi:MAG: hypothetical protein JWP94_1642 [Mucilaginibacter sp.]|jgi:FkbM family methyltransferase|nr:hypothetical protein [Mucilaginibacter sp.]
MKAFIHTIAKPYYNYKNREHLKNQKIQFLRCKPWFEVEGDKTFRLDYNELDENSVVFDLGGYEGQWASDIFSRYRSTIFIFEPYPPYAQKIRERFAKNPKIKTFEFGVAGSTADIPFSISDDSSSSFISSGDTTLIKLVRAQDFFIEHNIKSIDLLKLNIEGGEYDVLEHLIETGFIKNIQNIQVQFHDFIIPDAKQRMERIQASLAKTHEPTYQFEFVWENWKRKK